MSNIAPAFYIGEFQTIGGKLFVYTGSSFVPAPAIRSNHISALVSTAPAPFSNSVAIDKHFTFSQGSPAELWVITHNLAKNPSVTVTDSAGTVVVGEVTYINTNALTVKFAAIFAGKAYLN